MDSAGTEKLVDEYKSKLCRLNGIPTNDWSAGQNVLKFRKAVIAQARSIIETLERGEARRAAKAKAKADYTAAADKVQQDAARA